jgi:hypothetical protein
MLEPTLALQTALRELLTADPAISALVSADSIRSGDMRPDELPAILFGNGTTQMLGYGSGRQFHARVFMDLHIWAIEDGLDRAKTIGAAVAKALLEGPDDGEDFTIAEFDHTRTVWPRDPDPKFGHGVLSVEAVITWKL